MLPTKTAIFSLFMMLGSLGYASEKLSPEHQILQERLYSVSHCLLMMTLEGGHSVVMEFEVDATFYNAEATERRINKMMRLTLEEFDIYAQRFFENSRQSEYLLIKWRDADNLLNTWVMRQYARLIQDGLDGTFDEIDRRIRKCVEVYRLDEPEDDMLFDFDNAEIIKPPFEQLN